MALHLSNLYEYYKFHYPMNAFITEKEVRRICESYGLVEGPMSLYDDVNYPVPEKNRGGVGCF